MITLTHYLVLAAVLFCIGLFGVLTSRSALRVIVCVELMLNAVNINFVAFSVFNTEQPAAGISFVVFLIAVAAAEVGVALALIVSLSRTSDISAVDSYTRMRG